MLIYANGDWVESEHVLIPFNDQGFFYCDGLFETIQVNHENVFRQTRQMDRMRSSMDKAFISSTGIGVLPVTWEGYQSNYHHSQILREDLHKLFESGGSHVT